MNIPPSWHSVTEWMRRVSDAVNPLVRSWPSFTVPGALGFCTGAGGTVTQATSKATGVALAAQCGQIVTSAASLAAGAAVSFTLTNANIAASDVLVINHAAGGTFGAYSLQAQCGAGVATISIRNVTGGALAEALTIGFALIKGVTS